MTLSVNEPVQTRTAVTLFGIALALCLVCSQCSCTGGHAPIRHTALPTAATVEAKVGVPVAAAKASNARAVQLAAKAEKAGIVAGSADAHALTLATTETDQQLADALAGKDQLTAQLVADQKQVDALEKHDAAATARADAGEVKIKQVEKSRRWWIWLFVLSLVADFFVGEYIERELRRVVTLAWKWVAVGYHFAAGALKSLFPLYFFWLPA